MEELIRVSGRNDIEAWIATLKIVELMDRGRQWVVAGYVTAFSVPAAAVGLFS